MSLEGSPWVEQMWTLILVTFVVSGTSTGGVGTTTAFLDFPSEAKCRAAADVLAGADQINPTRGIIPTYRLQRTTGLLRAALSVDPDSGCTLLIAFD